MKKYRRKKSTVITHLNFNKMPTAKHHNFVEKLVKHTVSLKSRDGDGEIS